MRLRCTHNCVRKLIQGTLAGQRHTPPFPLHLVQPPSLLTSRQPTNDRHKKGTKQRNDHQQRDQMVIFENML
jgi:hypothetical protein